MENKKIKVTLEYPWSGEKQTYDVNSIFIFAQMDKDKEDNNAVNITAGKIHIESFFKHTAKNLVELTTRAMDSFNDLHPDEKMSSIHKIRVLSEIETVIKFEIEKKISEMAKGAKDEDLNFSDVLEEIADLLKCDGKCDENCDKECKKEGEDINGNN